MEPGRAVSGDLVGLALRGIGDLDGRIGAHEVGVVDALQTLAGTHMAVGRPPRASRATKVTQVGLSVPAMVTPKAEQPSWLKAQLVVAQDLTLVMVLMIGSSR